jgi:hypothetical protein
MDPGRTDDSYGSFLENVLLLPHPTLWSSLKIQIAAGILKLF